MANAASHDGRCKPARDTAPGGKPGDKAKVKPAGTKGGRPRRDATHMTPAKWRDARLMWEADHTKSATFVADEFGVTWRAVTERIKTERWTRETDKRLVHVPRPKPARPPWRPTSYRDEFPDRLIAFFREAAFEVVEVVTHDGRRKRKIVGAYEFPTLEDFADSIGVARQTMHGWATDTGPDGAPQYPRFYDAYKRAKDLQASILVKGGLAGVYQASAMIFAAKNLLGWRDKVDVDEGVSLDVYPDQGELDSAYARALERRAEQRAMIEARAATLASTDQIARPTTRTAQ